MVEESLTLLNASRVHISENRQTINNLIENLGALENKLNTVTQQIGERMTALETFIGTYFQMDLVMEEVKQIIHRVTFYLEHLQLQLNLLSLKRLAPSTITPNNLMMLLSEIESRLPSSLHLHGDPDKDLWTFYQWLTCATVLERKRILVIVPIPRHF